MFIFQYKYLIMFKYRIFYVLCGEKFPFQINFCNFAFAYTWKYIPCHILISICNINFTLENYGKRT